MGMRHKTGTSSGNIIEFESEDLASTSEYQHASYIMRYRYGMVDYLNPQNPQLFKLQI